MHIFKRRNYKWFCVFTLVIFLVGIVKFDLFELKKSLASSLHLPQPAKLLLPSRKYSGLTLKGIKLDKNNPYKINFIIDCYDKKNVSSEEVNDLIKYFLSALAVPEESLWVNLSPYESDRMINRSLGRTTLGSDMLAQDYVLKQFSSSLTYPKDKIGKQYWQSQIQKELVKQNEEYSKVWIMPDEISLGVQDGLIFIKNSSLDIKMEKDYFASMKNNVSQLEAGNSVFFKENILPDIKHEINHGKNFNKLRQIYNSLILGVYFKNYYIENIMKSYFDSNKVNGLSLEDVDYNKKVYDLYCKSFEKGVYSFVGKDLANPNKRRHYFSGGIELKRMFSSSSIEQVRSSVDIGKYFVSPAVVSVKLAQNESGFIDVYNVSSSSLQRLKKVKVGDEGLSFKVLDLGLGLDVSVEGQRYKVKRHLDVLPVEDQELILLEYINKFNKFNNINSLALRELATNFSKAKYYANQMLLIYKELMPVDPKVDAMALGLLTMKEDVNSLNKWINVIHQRLLNNFFNKQSEYSVLTKKITAEIMNEINYGVDVFNVIDLNNFKNMDNTAAGIFMEEISSLSPEVKVHNAIQIVSNRNQAWMHVAMGMHTSMLYANLTNPQADGEVRLSWFENDDSLPNLVRIGIIEKALIQEGFSVERFGGVNRDDYIELPGVGFIEKSTGKQFNSLKGGNLGIVAKINKDNSVSSVEVLSDKLRLVARILVGCKNLDTLFEKQEFNYREPQSFARIQWSIATLLRMAGGLSENIRYSDGQVEGVINSYVDSALAESIAIKDKLNQELLLLGLDEIVLGNDKFLSQSEIDEQYNRPIMRGIESGMFIRTARGVRLSNDYEPFDKVMLFHDEIVSGK